MGKRGLFNYRKAQGIESEMIFILAQLVIVLLTLSLWWFFISSSLNKDIFERRYTTQDMSLLTDIIQSSPNNVYTIYSYDKTHGLSSYYNVEFPATLPKPSNPPDFNKVLIYGPTADRKQVWYPYSNDKNLNLRLQTTPDLTANKIMLYKIGNEVNIKNDFKKPNLLTIKCPTNSPKTLTSKSLTTIPFDNITIADKDLSNEGKRLREIRKKFSSYTYTVNPTSDLTLIISLSDRNIIKANIPKNDNASERLVCDTINLLTDKELVEGFAIIPKKTTSITLELEIKPGTNIKILQETLNKIIK
jgi:hypothetical protein